MSPLRKVNNINKLLFVISVNLPHPQPLPKEGRGVVC